MFSSLASQLALAPGWWAVSRQEPTMAEINFCRWGKKASDGPLMAHEAYRRLAPTSVAVPAHPR